MALTRPPAPPRVPAPGAPLDPGYKIDPVPHLKWGRMLARVVRAHKRYRFAEGSPEEQELEEVAWVTLCRHARRLDLSLLRPDSTPGQLLRGSSKQNILTECRRAAEKLKRKGLTGLPEDDGKKPRCSTCTDVVGVLSADRRFDAGGENEEDGEADEPVICRAVHLPRPAPVAVGTGGRWRAFLARRAGG